MMLSKRYLDIVEGVFMLAAIDTFGGKRKAADSLGTSSETINKYIDHLKAVVGHELIYSDDKGSVLTPEGKAVLQVSRNHFQQGIDNIYRLAAKHEKLRGEIKIAMNVGARSCMPTKKIGDFLSRNTELSVISVISDSDPDLSGNTFDLAICYENPNDNNWRLVCHKKIACGFFASAKYLAKNGYPKDITDLLENYHVLIKENPQYVRPGGQDILRKGQHIVYCSNNSCDINDAICNGFGIGVMPICFTEEGIVCLDNIKIEGELYFNLLVRKEIEDVPQNRVVIDLYRKIIEAM